MQLFEIILFGLVCLSGVIILFCRYVKPELARKEPEPIYLDYARSFFPVFLLVFLLRGFIAEPFRIPSGSMLPTLEVGDFILVNKFSYGVRLPITHQKIINVGEPKRGDIVVFRYPPDPSKNYIKRLIGLPGDTIEYQGRNLFVNGKKVVAEPNGDYKPFGATLPSELLNQTISTGQANEDKVEFPILQANFGRFGRDMRRIVVPDGTYFMMGDNRDNSEDSRAWGFVPDENVIGRAFFIWMHFNGSDAKNGEEARGFQFSRFGKSIHPEPVTEGNG